MQDLTQSQPLDLIRGVTSKKGIEQLSTFRVAQEMQDGYIDPVTELVIATKLQAFFAARTSALRNHALTGMQEEKERGVLGSRVQKANEASRWEYTDPYLEELTTEVKTVQAKAQMKAEKDRVHITLAGEQIIITPAIKRQGGETVKVLL